jgi:isocitrate/isopropylmalate dehydrogenase
VYRDGRTLTPDVGGKATTAEFTQAIIRAMERPAQAGA